MLNTDYGRIESQDSNERLVRSHSMC